MIAASGSLFQSKNCNLFFSGIWLLPFYRGVRYSEVSARRELTVERKVEKLKYMKEVVEDRAAEYHAKTNPNFQHGSVLY